jgi:hypothetical protein
MVAEIQVEHVGLLPDAFVSAFASADGSDARMKVVEQFYEREEVALTKAGALPLRPNDAHQVYLVGSTSLIHIERQGPAGGWYVVQPVQQRQGTVEKKVLEDKIVSEMRKGRKLWLLRPKASWQSRPDGPQREFVRTSERLTQEDGGGPPSAVPADDIASTTSSPSPAAVADVGTGEEVDLKAFGQLRTILQNVRLQFWNGNFRSQPTESIKVAIQKAEDHDITGAIQAMEMLENVFVRLVEQWEGDFREAERRVRRGRGDPGDPAKFRTLKEHHLEMQSRIVQAKTKFRIMFNWLRDLETKMKRREQVCQKP